MELYVESISNQDLWADAAMFVICKIIGFLEIP